MLTIPSDSQINHKNSVASHLTMVQRPYFYLRLGMRISASPAIWQQFVDPIIQELKYPDDYKIIMDDALVFYNSC